MRKRSTKSKPLMLVFRRIARGIWNFFGRPQNWLLLHLSEQILRKCSQIFLERCLRAKNVSKSSCLAQKGAIMRHLTIQNAYLCLPPGPTRLCTSSYSSEYMKRGPHAIKGEPLSTKISYSVTKKFQQKFEISWQK